MKTTEMLALLAQAFAKRAATWRDNNDDPHNINTAVYVALMESSEAVKDALSQIRD